MKLQTKFLLLPFFGTIPRPIALFFLVLITESAVFQNTAKAQQNYLDYHQNCRLAERYFLSDNVDLCLQTYHSTFEKYEYNFPRDCFMAAQIAQHADRDSMAVIFLLRGMQFGLNPDFFAQDSISYPQMFGLKKTRHWSQVKNQKDSLSKVYYSSIDLELKNKIMIMVRQDQDQRERNNKWFNRSFRKGLERDFEALNRHHMAYLDSVFQKRGYPGSRMIGIGDSLASETNYASFNNANLNEMTRIILYHNDSAFVNYGDFLREEVKLGRLHPRTYAMIRDFRDRHLIKKDKDQHMYFNLWWERENYSEKEFEKHRNEIGCPGKNHLRALQKKLGEDYDVFWYPFR